MSVSHLEVPDKEKGTEARQRSSRPVEPERLEKQHRDWLLAGRDYLGFMWAGHAEVFSQEIVISHPTAFT